MTHVLVETYCKGRREASVVVDHDDAEHRRWMGRHCFWAFRNGREVRTSATEKPVNFVVKRGQEDAA